MDAVRCNLGTGGLANREVLQIAMERVSQVGCCLATTTTCAPKRKLKSREFPETAMQMPWQDVAWCHGVMASWCLAFHCSQCAFQLLAWLLCVGTSSALAARQSAHYNLQVSRALVQLS